MQLNLTTILKTLEIVKATAPQVVAMITSVRAGHAKIVNEAGHEISQEEAVAHLEAFKAQQDDAGAYVAAQIEKEHDADVVDDVSSPSDD